MLSIASICGAWWFDHRNLNEQITELENANLVSVIDSASLKFNSDRVLSRASGLFENLPIWPNGETEPPISISHARKIAKEVLSDLESCKSSAEYQDLTLSSIKLSPMCRVNSASEPMNYWGYTIDYSGTPVPTKNDDNKNVPEPALSRRRFVFRAVLMMDGTIYTDSKHCAKGVRIEMVSKYPSILNSVNPIRGNKKPQLDQLLNLLNDPKKKDEFLQKKNSQQ